MQNLDQDDAVAFDDDLVRQLYESAAFLDYLRCNRPRDPGAFGLELAADRLRDLAGEAKARL